MDKATIEALKGIEKIVAKIEENIKDSISDLKISVTKDMDEFKKCYETSRAVEEQQWTRMNTMQNCIDMNIRDGNLREAKIVNLESMIQGEVKRLHLEIEKLPNKIKANRKWIIATMIAFLTVGVTWFKEIFNIFKK
jgi:hypothetical protein